MGLWHLFSQWVWTASGSAESAGVLGKSLLLTTESSCGWCGLHLSGRSPLGLEAGPSSTRARENWDGVGLRKGHRGENLGRGAVPLVNRFLAHSLLFKLRFN